LNRGKASANVSSRRVSRSVRACQERCTPRQCNADCPPPVLGLQTKSARKVRNCDFGSAAVIRRRRRLGRPYSQRRAARKQSSSKLPSRTPSTSPERYSNQEESASSRSLAGAAATQGFSFSPSIKYLVKQLGNRTQGGKIFPGPALWQDTGAKARPTFLAAASVVLPERIRRMHRQRPLDQHLEPAGGLRVDDVGVGGEELAICSLTDGRMQLEAHRANRNGSLWLVNYGSDESRTRNGN